MFQEDHYITVKCGTPPSDIPKVKTGRAPKSVYQSTSTLVLRKTHVKVLE